MPKPVRRRRSLDDAEDSADFFNLVDPRRRPWPKPREDFEEREGFEELEGAAGSRRFGSAVGREPSDAGKQRDRGGRPPARQKKGGSGGKR